MGDSRHLHISSRVNGTWFAAISTSGRRMFRARSYLFLVRGGCPMKARIFLAPLMLVVACTAMAAYVQQADDKNLFKQYVEKFGSPGSEHKMLEPLIGTWNARCKMWTDPSQAPE